MTSLERTVLDAIDQLERGYAHNALSILRGAGVHPTSGTVPPMKCEVTK